MRRSTIAFVLLLLTAASLHADFMLWIERPKKRTNPNDRRSSFYVDPIPATTVTFTRTPTSLNTATSSPSATPTFTATRTATSSATRSSTSTLTVTPLATSTNTPTVSGTPSQTSTSSVTPVNTATFTRTASPSATATITPSASPTATPTPKYDAQDTATGTADNATGGATALGAVTTTLGTTSAHFVGYGVDAADYFSAALTNGQVYTFLLSPLVGSATVEIRNSADVLVSGPTAGGISSFTIASGTGTYYIVVKGGPADYTLTYQDVTGATPTFTYTVTSTRTNSPLPTNTFSPTSTFTATPSSSPTGTPTITSTLSPVVSATYTQSNTPAPSPTLTTIGIATLTITLSATQSPTAVVTATSTPMTCTAAFTFESGIAGWEAANGWDSGVSAVAAGTMAQCGTGALDATVNLVQTAAPAPGGGAQTQGQARYVYSSPQDLSCKILSAWVYVPAGMSDSANPSGAMLYVQTASYAFHAAAWTNLPDVGGWTQLTYDLTTVGGDEAAVKWMGVAISLGGSSPDWAGTISIDEFDLQDKGGCTAPTPTFTPTPAACPALFSFESTSEGWVTADAGAVSLAQSTTQATCGTGSLSLTVNLNATNTVGSAQVDSGLPANNGCKILKAKLWIPTGLNGAGAMLYVLHGGSWAYAGQWTNLPGTAGWVTLSDLDMSGFSDTINRIGVQVNLGGPPPAANFAGTVYIDQVEIVNKPGCGGTPTPTPTPGGCNAPYSFEADAQGWALGGDTGGVSIAQGTTQAICGVGSLGLTVNLTAANPTGAAEINSPAVVNNGCKLIQAKVWVPAGLATAGVMIYALDSAWGWHGQWSNLAAGWNVLTPLDYSGITGTINRVGIQVNLGGPPPAPDFAGTVYIDQVEFTDKPGC